MCTRGSHRFSVARFSCSGVGQGGSPRLSAVQVTADGLLQGLGELESQSDKDHAEQEASILIAQLLGLLRTFIGETLTCGWCRMRGPMQSSMIPIHENGRTA